MNMSHYDWLQKHFSTFCKNAGIKCYDVISAHGDKCYGYKRMWKEKGIPFEHGVAIFLLTYLKPHCDDVRETKAGWVDPADWVIQNYEKFKPFFPKG